MHNDGNLQNQIKKLKSKKPLKIPHTYFIKSIDMRIVLNEKKKVKRVFQKLLSYFLKHLFNLGTDKINYYFNSQKLNFLGELFIVLILFCKI